MTDKETCSVNDFDEMTYDGRVRDVNFPLATIKTKKPRRAFFLDKVGLRKKMLSDSGNQVLISKRKSKLACAWYQPKKGAGTVGR